MQIAATPKIRLFSSDKLVAGSDLWISGERARYVTRVLRLRADDTILMFDGSGGQYRSTISSLTRDRVLVHIGEYFDEDCESPLAIDLVQGISRGGRMDVVIQKSTELGVRRITPVITDFSVVRLDDDRAARRLEHWQKISQSACEQCGRNVLPRVDMPRMLGDWLDERCDRGMTAIVLDPGSRESLGSLETPETGVELLIGPEGGFSDAERSRCQESGFSSVSLGPRVLRTETAALAAIAVLQSLWGDLRQA